MGAHQADDDRQGDPSVEKSSSDEPLRVGIYNNIENDYNNEYYFVFLRHSDGNMTTINRYETRLTKY